MRKQPSTLTLVLLFFVVASYGKERQGGIYLSYPFVLTPMPTSSKARKHTKISLRGSHNKTNEHTVPFQRAKRGVLQTWSYINKAKNLFDYKIPQTLLQFYVPLSWAWVRRGCTLTRLLSPDIIRKRQWDEMEPRRLVPPPLLPLSQPVRDPPWLRKHGKTRKILITNLRKHNIEDRQQVPSKTVPIFYYVRLLPKYAVCMA
jgi:hypothetical protein